MSLPLKESQEYFGLCDFNYKKTDDTACGKTADKVPEEPPQTKCVGSETTDARKIANAVFAGSSLPIPATTLVISDTYDVTQARTRLNLLYVMTRADFYHQASSAVETRQNRIKRKAAIVSDTLRTAEDVQKLYGVKE